MILFGKTNQWESCRRTLELRPTCMQYIKTRRGHSRAMHWCYKVVDSTLIFHFSLAFSLGHSVNPLGPIFAVCTVDSRFYDASVLRAHLLHCVGVSSLLLAAIWLFKNLGFFPSTPLSTLSRRECIFQLDTVHVSIVEDILCFCQLVLLGDKGRVYVPSACSYQVVYGGCTSFKFVGKLQVIPLSFQFKK